MKLQSIIIAAAAAAALSACNDIAPADRLIDLPPVEAKRVVLLEEFTGQECVNCPSAHKTIEALLEEYPENLIAVSLHAGPLAIHENKLPFGLANDQSNAYYKQYGSPSLPAGVVNRAAKTTTTADKWATAVKEEIQRPAHLDLAISSAVAGGGVLKVSVGITPHENVDGRLMVWVVESGIEAMQKDLGGAVHFDYVHNHVFRQAITPLDGEPMALITREPESREFDIPLQEKWNAANLSVVAFIYNDTGVLQAATAPAAKD